MDKLQKTFAVAAIASAVGFGSVCPAHAAQQTAAPATMTLKQSARQETAGNAPELKQAAKPVDIWKEVSDLLSDMGIGAFTLYFLLKRDESTADKS